MKVTILTIGSRGDVQPYIAFGKALKAAGHTVKLATSLNFRNFVCEHDLDFAPMEGDVRQFMESDAGKKMMSTERNVLAFMRSYKDAAEPLVIKSMQNGFVASQDADVIVTNNTSIFMALSIHERLKIPLIQAYLQPVLPSRAFQNIFIPPAPAWLSPFKGTYNLLSGHAIFQMFWQLMRNSINKARREVLNLPAWPFGGPSLKLLRTIPLLYAFSPSVISRSADMDEKVDLTGFWFLDRAADWQPPVDLVKFLNAGVAPVYVGFGSMTDQNAENITQITLEALSRTGQRGVLLSGWTGLGDMQLPESVFCLDAIPHDWLFPQMAAIVHHGGAGTTASALRSGRPSFIVPFVADQPFWGERVHTLGVGPAPISRKHLTADNLAAAITTAVNNREMQACAATFGERINSEHGVDRAVEAFHRFLRV